MRNKIYLSLIAVAVLLGSIGWTVSAQKNSFAKQTWEYKVVTMYGSNYFLPNNREQLNRLGNEGWELVTILYEQSDRNASQQREAQYYFKRAK